MVSSGCMLLVAVVFFHSTLVLLGQVRWDLLSNRLLFRSGLHLFLSVRSIVLLVSMCFVCCMLLVSLVTLLVTGVVLAWVLCVGLCLALVLLTLSVDVHTSYNGAIIDEHSLSARQVDQSIEFVSLGEPLVVVSLQLYLALMFSLVGANISMGNLLLVSLLWSGVMSPALSKFVMLFTMTMLKV